MAHAQHFDKALKGADFLSFQFFFPAFLYCSSKQGIHPIRTPSEENMFAGVSQNAVLIENINRQPISAVK